MATLRLRPVTGIRGGSWVSNPRGIRTARVTRRSCNGVGVPGGRPGPLTTGIYEHHLAQCHRAMGSLGQIRPPRHPHNFNGKGSKDLIVANRIFTALANQTIDTFASCFVALSKEVFYDQENEKLRHPGEFGAFRERLCAQFLKLFIPSYLDVSSGFLINNNDQVSKQCDLIIYDQQYTPMITDAQNLRFFPIETVVCIGEVKSTIARQEF